MNTQIIDGKKMATAIAERLLPRLSKLPPLVLAVVVVGKNPVSSRYVRAKTEQGRQLGIEVRVYDYKETVSEEELESEIKRLGNDTAIHGLIVQLPLPKHFDTDRIIKALPNTRDIDALSAEPLVDSPVVGAVGEILAAAGREPQGLATVVIGAGRLVGRPVAYWLAQHGARVITTTDIEKERPALKTADLIISGVGKPHIIRPDDVREGVIIIDAATNEDGGKLSGDADPACAARCSVFTPVPGGVGPITLVKLFENLVTLAQRQIIKGLVF